MSAQRARFADSLAVIGRMVSSKSTGEVLLRFKDGELVGFEASSEGDIIEGAPVFKITVGSKRTLMNAPKIVLRSSRRKK